MYMYNKCTINLSHAGEYYTTRPNFDIHKPRRMSLDIACEYGAVQLKG